jgi:SOUL heme-binding protein
MLQAIWYYAVLAGETAVCLFGIRLYEEPPYSVIDRVAGRVEIRRYASRVVAEVTLSGPGEAGRDDAFRVLFAYIAGANRNASFGADRIAMTVPVVVQEGKGIATTVPVQTSDENGGPRMQFVLPAKFRSRNAPKPMDPRVRIMTVPEQTIAVLRFSGSGSDFPERESELLFRLGGQCWRPVGAPYRLLYDAPFTLPFLRRNEAAVAVEAGS